MRTKNMQAFVDNLPKHQGDDYIRRATLMMAVERPEELDRWPWRGVAQLQHYAEGLAEYGRAEVAEVIRRKPEMLDGDQGQGIKAIMGGWEYAEKFLAYLEKEIEVSIKY